MDRVRLLARLVNIALLLGIVVIVLGAFTRLVDAGLGCPDWPGCYGFASWPSTHSELLQAQERFPGMVVDAEKAWPEMVHRYFAGTLGLLVLTIAGFSFRYAGIDANFRRSGIAGLSVFLLVFIAFQAAFGMWTVTLKLWPQIVTVHLLGGFTTLALLWVLRLKLQPEEPASQGRAGVASKGLIRHAKIGFAVLVIQIALGGWTTSNYAALACPDFPTCQNQVWPDMDIVQGFDVLQTPGPNYLGGLMSSKARIAIHVMHRSGAAVTFVVLLLLGLRLLSLGAGAPVTSTLVKTMLGLLTLQLLLGVSNVVFSVPLIIATMHNGVGALLLLSVVSLNFQILHFNRRLI